MTEQRIGKKLKDIAGNPFIQCIVVQIVILFMQFQMVDFCFSPDLIIKLKISVILFNFITYAGLWLLVKAIFGKWWISNVILSFLLMIFAIVNYYVILFHGSPLSYLEFANFQTAMGVIGNYTFYVTKRIIGIFLFTIIEILLSLFIRKKERNIVKNKNRKIVSNIVAVIFVIAFFIWGYVSDYGFRDKLTVKWNWYLNYQDCRVLPSFIESFVQGINPVKKPEEYSVEKVMEIKNTIQNTSVETEVYPDIIFILNESFYELDYVTDIDTDLDYLQEWHNLDNKITGYAVSAMVGGGTNCSEYELLTSNSLQLLGNITPFTTLKIRNANSIASFLKDKGYYTLGAHPSGGSSYMRSTGYPGLGFEEVHFIEDFENLEVYYNRNYPTDVSSYRNLLNWYEEMPDGPRFLYLLTFQNHGDWNRNESQYDLVHSNKNYGDLTGAVNEYLTSVYMSDQALAELIQYYEEGNRPVIICMVGDHAPSIVTDLTDSSFSEDEKALRQRSIPFVIWSNMFEESKDIGTISMIYLVPTLLEEAGMPLSDYYRYLVDLRNEVPILTSYGVYYDKDGKMYTYEDQTEYSEKINNYFFMEYYNVCDQKDGVADIFR